MKKILLHRDFFILVLLLILLRIGSEMKDRATTSAPLIQSATALKVAHTNTINRDDAWEVTGEEHSEKNAPFNFHEIDHDVIKQIEHTQQQITKALSVINPASLDASQLRNLQQKLSQLKTQYEHNSPAFALLGPMGTAGIVFKEEQLEKELLESVEKLATILHALSGSTYKSSASVIKELESNHKLLNNLIVV